MKSFYKEKKVFLTGHTGFKGAWLCALLTELGAEVTGFSLEPPVGTSLFELLKSEECMTSVIGDIRDFDSLRKAYKTAEPDIVLHLAAQPIVRESYANPLYTYETNVMGTANLLECVRLYGAQSVVNITTDKVYLNNEWEWGYRENEPLCGYDPYSNSKSCSELVTYSYNQSYFRQAKIPVSTARAGNVIGGGDFAKDRIIPDCVRAARTKTALELRNPYSTRPYQHVLEPIFAYLLIAQKQSEKLSLADCYNVGPDEHDCVTTGYLTDIFCKAWNSYTGQGINCKITPDANAPHEANFLKLDCSKIKTKLWWKPVYNISQAIAKTVEWSAEEIRGADARELCRQQIKQYMEDYRKHGKY
jgi:CDP-glucose 4,6-dehydratase